MERDNGVEKGPSLSKKLTTWNKSEEGSKGSLSKADQEQMKPGAEMVPSKVPVDENTEYSSSDKRKIAEFVRWMDWKARTRKCEVSVGRERRPRCQMSPWIMMRVFVQWRGRSRCRRRRQVCLQM